MPIFSIYDFKRFSIPTLERAWACLFLAHIDELDTDGHLRSLKVDGHGRRNLDYSTYDGNLL